EPRPPGVPPPVDPSRVPSPATAAVTPFDNSVPGLRQVRGPEVGDRGCVAPGTLPDAVDDVENQPWGQTRLRLRDLHRFATGRNQVVAVIDTGVTAHPRLAGRLIGGGDYVQGGTGLDDCDGHGTVVAGIIAAARDTSGDTAFQGIAPDSTILSIRQSTAVLEVRYFDERQAREIEQAGAGNTTSLAYAVVHAVEQGATVINISEAACFAAQPDQVNGTDLQAAVHWAVERNVVVVAAAGNADEQSRCNPANPSNGVVTVASPAWFDDDVLTVGAIGEDGEPAGFTLAGPWVDVAAPGTEITSLDPVPGSPRLTNFTVSAQGQQGPIQGTSFATPYVAGLAALIRERFPRLTARQVMERIERTAVQSAGLDGHSAALGHGMIDPVAALTDVLPEESGVQPVPRGPSDLGTLTPQPVKDPFPTKVALIGAGSGLVALAITGFVVYTVQRARGRRATARAT
ncbi:MAG TPA: type VII secretion-associated serine protease mycosin, partial [Pseudonocardiaceae bacterium]